jgi:hypothetical protein
MASLSRVWTHRTLHLRLLPKGGLTENYSVGPLFGVCAGLLDNFTGLPKYICRWRLRISASVENDWRDLLVHVDALFLTYDIHTPSDPVPLSIDDDGAALTAATRK